uniref:Uncharacterized protein n=1 Tax=Anguilla anguilla TaxID=7936 RepID=A0A0E9WSW2_ANGAN
MTTNISKATKLSTFFSGHLPKLHHSLKSEHPYHHMLSQATFLNFLNFLTLQS